MKGRRLTSTGGGVTLHNPPTRGYARALGLRKGFSPVWRPAPAPARQPIGGSLR